VTSGGENLDDSPENQLTKFRAVYTVRANRRPKFCRSLIKGTIYTEQWNL